MYAYELSIAAAAAREAGQIALGLQAGIQSTAKADGSPVTPGDLAADACIRHHLQQAFPADAILSEELVDDHVRLRVGRVWIIDPIDGTKQYAKGEGGWCIQVALAVDGAVVLGVLDLPRERVRLTGLVGEGAMIEDEAGPRPISAPTTAISTLIASSSERNREALVCIRAALPDFAVTTCSSVGVKVWHLLCGDADCYVHARPIHEWDVAAPAAVLIAAGGYATALVGGPLRYNTPSSNVPGLVFSTRADHAQLITRLANAGIRPPE